MESVTSRFGIVKNWKGFNQINFDRKSGQKAEIKVQVVVQGFKYKEKVQSDSHTAAQREYGIIFSNSTMLNFKNL